MKKLLSNEYDIKNQINFIYNIGFFIIFVMYLTEYKMIDVQNLRMYY